MRPWLAESGFVLSETGGLAGCDGCIRSPGITIFLASSLTNTGSMLNSLQCFKNRFILANTDRAEFARTSKSLVSSSGVLSSTPESFIVPLACLADATSLDNSAKMIFRSLDNG